MDEESSKFTTALKQLKCRLKIARLQTDCIGRVEAMYLLDTFNPYAFAGKDVLDRCGINDVGHNFKYKKVITRLIVDDNGSTIDIDNSAGFVNEEDVFKAVLERCNDCSVYVLYGHRGTGQRELLMNKGTTVEQLLVEKELEDNCNGTDLKVERWQICS